VVLVVSSSSRVIEVSRLLIDRSGRVADFQCKLLSGDRACRSGATSSNKLLGSVHCITTFAVVEAFVEAASIMQRRENNQELQAGNTW